MFTSIRCKRRGHDLNMWPGFVDAMSTLLMVIIFVLMTFVVSQLFLTEALNTKDSEVLSLTKIVNNLQKNLNIAIKNREENEEKIKNLDSLVIELKSQLSILESNLGNEIKTKDKVTKEAISLSEQITQLKQEINRLNESLDTTKSQTQDKSQLIVELQKKIDQILLDKIEELKALNKELEQLKNTNKQLETSQIKYKKVARISQYRSEFFAQLQAILGDEHKGFLVYGDRFIFQSEVLFDEGSAALGDNGKKQLDYLAKVLLEIAKQIPSDLNWILRIDGHTDKRPIKNSQFSSNWELSTARAISVVKYLIDKNIPPQHLVAAGFGEYQALTSKETDIAKNRRIEFKLDQR